MRAQAVMVALPGTMCSPAVFEPLALALAGQVTVDPFSWLTQPGPWDIPAVAERVADHIGQRWGHPVLVCGHSTGGAIALQLAITRPAAVLGLVLVDTGAHMRGHGDVDVILHRIRDDWGDELHAAVLDRSFLVPPVPEVRAGYLRWAAALSQQAVYDVLASQRDLDLTGELAGIGVPAVVLHGRHDLARPPQQGRELAQSLPDAEFRLVEAGHTPVYETPDAVAAAVHDVLARTRTPAPNATPNPGPRNPKPRSPDSRTPEPRNPDPRNPNPTTGNERPRMTTTTMAELPSLKGQELGTSEWIEITQDRVNTFADATDDHQWIHVDVERAKRESPFGGPIAHGYLTLSLLIPMWSQVLKVTDAAMGVNYGLGKVRFPAPVPVGGKIRLTATLTDVTEVQGGLQVTVSAVVELAGGGKPVCVAEPIFRFYAS